MVLFKDSVGSFRVYRILVYIDHGQTPSLLLGYSKNVTLKARRLDANHIAIPLKEVRTQDEVVAYFVHRLTEVRPPIGVVPIDVKIGDARNLVRCESDFLVSYLGNSKIPIGGRDLCVVLDRPIKNGAKLVAHRLNGRGFEAARLAEGDEILPKNVRHLDGIECHAIVGFKGLEIVDKATEGLLVLLVEFRLRRDTTIDHLH